MPKKLQTNEDLVVDLMNYSPYGGLCQGFIMQAIQHYAAQVLAGPDIEAGGMISNDAWKGIAADVKRRCDAFYGRHDKAPAKPAAD